MYRVRSLLALSVRRRKFSAPASTPKITGKNADVLETVSTHDATAEDPNAAWFVDPAYIDRDVALQQNLARKSTASVPLWMQSMQTTETENVVDVTNVHGAVKVLCDRLKAQNVSVMDMRHRCLWTQHFVIAEGVNDAHVARLAEGFYQIAKKQKRDSKRRMHLEGEGSDEWKLIDLGDYVVHIFTPDARERYDLEGLWERVEIDPESGNPRFRDDDQPDASK